MFNVDDILEATFGYDCTLVNFYRVLRVTKTQVYLTEIESEIVDHDGYGQAGHVRPVITKVIGDPFRRKIQDSGYVKIQDYMWAKKWDGKPVHFDSYD